MQRPAELRATGAVCSQKDCPFVLLMGPQTRTVDLSIFASRRHFSTGSMHLRNRSMLSSSKRARVMEL